MGLYVCFFAFVKTKTKTATLSSASSQNTGITDGGSHRDLSCNLYTVDIIFQTGRIIAIGECFPWHESISTLWHTALMAGAPWRQRPAGLFKRKGKFFLLLLQCFFTPFAPCNVSFLILLRLKVDDSTCAPFTCFTMEGVNAPKWHAGAWHCPYMLQQLWQVAGTHALLALSDPHTQHTVSLRCFNEHYFYCDYNVA